MELPAIFSGQANLTDDVHSRPEHGFQQGAQAMPRRRFMRQLGSSALLGRAILARWAQWAQWVRWAWQAAAAWSQTMPRRYRRVFGMALRQW